MSFLRGSAVVAILVASVGCSSRPVGETPVPGWQKLETEPARERQDDISLIDADTGWYVNSLGKIFKTVDGGRSWVQISHKPGTYWRSILFLDAHHGFAGNLGPGVTEGYRSVMSSDEFENLNREPKTTDPVLIYETSDGGRTWVPAPGVPADGGGVCSMSSLTEPGGRRLVFAGGRVTGPPRLFRWTEGQGWDSIDLAGRCGMVLDVNFFDARTGIVCAASSPNLATAQATLLMTEDGGRTWEERYRSPRPGETVWKCSFPTRDTGYATIRSFDPDPHVTRRYVLKTIDGGRTWREILLVDDFYSRPQAVGFLTPDRGWVGTSDGGFETTDGGATWTRVKMGRSLNRIRFVPTSGGGTVIYAIGRDLYKLRLR